MSLSVEDIERLAVEHEAFGFGLADDKAPSTHGFDPDGLVAFARAVERAARASERERMIADGWRRCAVGQRTTQFCGMAEQARADEREAMIARLEQRMAQCDNAAGVLDRRLMGVLRHEAAMNVEWLRARGEAKGCER